MQETQLKRALSARQIRFMALGAAIGVGLFLGSAKAIQMAGPSVLIAYMVAGAIIFLIMRALGELAVDNPVSGSFSTYAAEYLGPFAGFLTGWNYWIMNIGVGIAEVTAVAIYMKLWFPDVPQWIWALASVITIGALNLITVKLYGELEFWFALIKVGTMLLLIAGGLGMIVLGWGNSGVPIGVANLWSHGGWFPHGVSGLLMSLPIVVYAYAGIEMIGLTAGEVQQPERTIPSAINSVLWRILLFYVGSLAVILAIYPWDQIGTAGSPFVTTFERLGIREAAGLINFVVITAALSSFNCTIFGSSRVLHGLAMQKQAPAMLGRTAANGVPVQGVLLSLVCLLAGVLMNYLAPESIFGWLMALLSFTAVWTWATIVLAHYRFRLQRKRLHQPAAAFPMFAWPLTSWIALLFLVFLVGTMAAEEKNRISLFVGVAWIAFLGIAYTVGGVGTRAKRFEPAPINAGFSAPQEKLGGFQREN
ncbi:amino acid permease [Variovorax sp. VaC1]|uniref:amino acid permease n=1 Tax=Variovorax sp. VaC1 TaxID=3373132 RepID=UPI003749C2CE